MNKDREEEKQRLQSELRLLQDRFAHGNSLLPATSQVNSVEPPAKLRRRMTILGAIKATSVPELEAPLTHFFAHDPTNMDHVRPKIEEFVKYQSEMGSIAEKMALVDRVVKAYEDSAIWKTIDKEGIWSFEITDMPTPITERRREWFRSFMCQKEMAILCRLRQLELYGQYDFVTSEMSSAYTKCKLKAQEKLRKGIKVDKDEEFFISDETNNRVLKALDDINHKQFEFSEKLFSAFSKYNSTQATQWALKVEIKYPGIFGAPKRT